VATTVPCAGWAPGVSNVPLMVIVVNGTAASFGAGGEQGSMNGTSLAPQSGGWD